MGFLKVPAGYTTGRMMQHAAHTNLLNTNALIFLARLHTTEAYGSVQGSVFVDRRAGGDSSAVQDQLQRQVLAWQHKQLLSRKVCMLA